jgi:Tol biopolymer transport system component
MDAVVDTWSDTKITFTMPAGLSKALAANVSVTTDDGVTITSQIDITPPNTYKVTSDHAMDHYPCWGKGDDWIYFSSTRADYNWDIWRIPAIGGVAERVTSDPTPDFYPAVRLSSGELAWCSQRKFGGLNPEGDYEIFRGFPICPEPGTACTTTLVTSNNSRDLYPAWAGTVYSGYSMAYTWEEVDQSGHYVAWKVMLSSGTGPVELTFGEQPAFSPDGQWVVYSLENNIYKIPTGGGAAIQLTTGGHDRHPHWGSVNDKIVFERTNDGNFEDIFVMDSDGTDVQPLVSTPDDEYRPRWSSDCSKVVYYALVTGTFDIYVCVAP